MSLKVVPHSKVFRLEICFEGIATSTEQNLICLASLSCFLRHGCLFEVAVLHFCLMEATDDHLMGRCDEYLFFHWFSINVLKVCLIGKKRKHTAHLQHVR